MDCTVKYCRYKIMSMAIIALFLCLFSVIGMAAEPAALSSANSSYDCSQDSFYSKINIYVTWIMIWNGSTEKHWWKSEDYNGCKVFVDGKWQSINWNDKNHIKTYFDAIKSAGMEVIVVDFTNGSSVIINRDNVQASQRWFVRKQDVKYIFINRANGLALDYSDSSIILNPENPTLPSQRWSLLQIAILPK